MALRTEIKRGDTFVRTCTARDSATGPFIDLTDWAIASQIRDENDVLVAELDVVPVDLSSGAYQLKGEITQDWPAKMLYWDIQYTDPGGRVSSTQTVEVLVRPDVTHA